MIREEEVEEEEPQGADHKASQLSHQQQLHHQVTVIPPIKPHPRRSQPPPSAPSAVNLSKAP